MKNNNIFSPSELYGYYSIVSWYLIVAVGKSDSSQFFIPVDHLQFMPGYLKIFSILKTESEYDSLCGVLDQGFLEHGMIFKGDQFNSFCIFWKISFILL